MLIQLPSYWFNKSAKTQRRVQAYDAGGGPITNYTDSLTGLPLRFNPNSSSERGSQGRLNSETSDTVYINGNPVPDVVQTDRIIFDGRVFDVLGVRNMDESAVFLTLDVVEVLPSGVGA